MRDGKGTGYVMTRRGMRDVLRTAYCVWVVGLGRRGSCGRRALLAGLCGLVLAGAAGVPATAQEAAQEGAASRFVQVEDARFVVDGHPYYFAGVNLWFGMHLGADRAIGDRERLRRELDHLARLGVTNLRVMAASEGPNTEPWRITPAAQPSPRAYDEAVLRGLDVLLAELDARGMKAVLVLNNFFQWSGGMAQYVAWTTGTEIPYPTTEQGGASWDDFQQYAARFYADDAARLLFLDYVHTLVHRTNTVTGRRYRDDPTIMAWQLANEPRGFDLSDAYVAWVDEAAGFLQLIAPNHLVSLGGEGKLTAWEATQFERVSRSPHLDYLTVHIWIENWGWYDPARPEATFPTAVGRAMGYLADHVSLARALGKPLVLEEFGVSRDGRDYAATAPTTYRDRFFRMMHEAVYKLALEGNAVGGANVWSWSGSATPPRPGAPWQPGEPLVGDPPHEAQGWYSIYDADTTTLNILAEYAGQMQALSMPGELPASDLLEAARTSLRDDLLAPFYPRAVDGEHGGFLSGFAHDWTPLLEQDKMIVTQARHIWTLAKAAAVFPEQRTVYLDAAAQGVAFLRERMWDDAAGGFVSLVARDGTWKRGGDPFTQGKTAYGNAFAVYGLAAYHAATGDTAALGLAQRTFRWLDAHLYDPEHGGYFQFAAPGGGALAAGWGPHPPKDQNSSIHLLEAFTELYAVWPDPVLRERLEELLVLIRDTLTAKPGYLRLFFEADWTPVSYRDSTEAVRAAHYDLDHVSYGHDVETAFLMLEAAHVLGLDPAPTLAAGKRMVDHALMHGWDAAHGGFYNGGVYETIDGPPVLAGTGKTWWAQAEGLHTLLVMAQHFPDDPIRYRERFDTMWAYIQRYLIDPEHGGWYQGGLDAEPGQAAAPKATLWKAAYHDGRALMNVARLLKQEAAPTSSETH